MPILNYNFDNNRKKSYIKTNYFINVSNFIYLIVSQ